MGGVPIPNSSDDAEPTTGSDVSVCHASCWCRRRAIRHRGSLGRSAVMKQIVRLFLIDKDAPTNISVLFGGAASLLSILMLVRMISVYHGAPFLVGVFALIGIVSGIRGRKTVKKKLYYWGIGLSIARFALVVLGFISKPNQLPDPTSPSVTPAAGAAGAPSVAADH